MTDIFKILSNAGASGFKGFTTGMQTGNPWAAIGGAIGGSVSGAYNAYADPSGFYGYQNTWNNIMNSDGSGGTNPVTSQMGSAIKANNSGKLDIETLKQLFGN